jgi:hypothetical protein
MRALRARTPTAQVAASSPDVSSGPATAASAPHSPTYERFLEAHLALHRELADDQDFALQYLSYLPAGRRCPDELALLQGSEVDRQRFFAEVWPAWKAGFAATVAQARAPAADEVFRAELERSAGAYDFKRQAFAVTLAEGSGGFGAAGAELIVGDARYSGAPGRTQVLQPSGAGGLPVGFALDLTNADLIDNLPLSGPEAEAFDRRSADRKIRFQVDFVLEQTEPTQTFAGAAPAKRRRRDRPGLGRDAPPLRAGPVHARRPRSLGGLSGAKLPGAAAGDDRPRARAREERRLCRALHHARGMRCAA